MQRETHFHIHFQFNPSTEYTNLIDAFVEEIIESFTWDYLLPDVYCPNNLHYGVLNNLRRDYEQKLETLRFLKKYPETSKFTE